MILDKYAQSLSNRYVFKTLQKDDEDDVDALDTNL